MLEPAAAGGAEPRAFLRVGGLSVAHQQLGLALALNCQRVVCIARGLAPELVEMQHAAERAGTQFHAIPGPRPLVGLVTAADDVVVLGDGLFASVEEAAALLEKGPGVLVQPIDQGLIAGFERIDLNSASAAAMRLPGRLIERLAELPVDCDAVSALQRIALQAGVPQRQIAVPDGNGIFWTLIRTEADAHALEPRWIRQRTQDELPASLGQWIARAGVRALGPALLHAGTGSGAIVIAALVLAVLGLGAAWLGFVPLGLGLCAIGWILRQSAQLLARIENISSLPSRARLIGQELYGWGLDGLIVTMTAWGTLIEPGQSLVHRYFAPLMLVALLRIVPRATGGRWVGLLEDRALLCVLLAGAIFAGVGSESIQIGALGLVMAGIIVPRGELRLTRP